VALGTSALTVLVLVALLLGAIGCLLAGVALAREPARGRPRPRGRAAVLGARLRRRTAVAPPPLTTDQMTMQIHDLQLDAATALRHVAVVRYDAFADMGGHLSWSLALLDDQGDGVVLTSIHGRSDSRTYAKNVSGWSASQPLSPEEGEAVRFARTPA
jgi:hypothetical protein